MILHGGMLDDDAYKIKTCYAINKFYPNSTAQFKFINRGNHKFNLEFANELHETINEQFPGLYVTNLEIEFLRKKFPELDDSFIEWFRNYRYNPNEVEILYNTDGELDITITGEWKRITLWEIKLLYVISELYYKHCCDNFDKNGYKNKLDKKVKILRNLREETLSGYVVENEFETIPLIDLSEFGTRRRASYDTQDKVILALHSFISGTSNMHFSMGHNLALKGTMPHEWIMGVSALESLRYANRFALEKWAEVWKNPGIALSDTYGTKAFLKDFDYRLANLYDGTRHDSGDPYKYVEDIIEHYNNLVIDISSKIITFSDNLNFEKMERIHRYCFEQNIKCNFGIGTFLTNDFENTKPLNIVIKPFFINDIPVVKLGEGDGKVNGGSEEAIRYAKWVFGMQ